MFYKILYFFQNRNSFPFPFSFFFFFCFGLICSAICPVSKCSSTKQGLHVDSPKVIIVSTSNRLSKTFSSPLDYSTAVSKVGSRTFMECVCTLQLQCNWVSVCLKTSYCMYRLRNILLITKRVSRTKDKLEMSVTECIYIFQMILDCFQKIWIDSQCVLRCLGCIHTSA